MNSFPFQPLTSLADLRILIVDPHIFTNSLLLEHLYSIGVALVTPAASAAAALRAVRRSSEGFDIVICGVGCDYMDSMEFIRGANQASIGGMILMSALREDLFAAAAATARSYGVQLLGLLPEPVEQSRLQRLLARYSSLHRGPPACVTKTRRPQWSRTDLVEALEQEQFLPYFQPKVDLATNCPIGVEMLARWNHPELGLLPPSEFIRVMEQTKLIDDLGRSLFRQALECAGHWPACGLEIGLAVNASPLTLQNSDAAAEMADLASACCIAPEQITVEVTETAMSQDGLGLLKTLTNLRLEGFKLSADDFGTGYSSLQQLSTMPFTEIKIDRMFVAGISDSRKSGAILESIVRLADNLGMSTVAEGIQSEEQRDFIRSTGCHVGQSFYLAEPMDQEHLLAYCNSAAMADAGRRENLQAVANA